MRDGALRRCLKTVARWHFYLGLATTRGLRRLEGERPYLLAGACRGCASCCEAPSIQVGRAVWYLRSLRWVFLAWQRHVNGFELVGREQPRTLVFRCTHFDPSTRRCDSYASRPGMCRDYPRALLWQVEPALFEGCGYRPLAHNATALMQELDVRGLTPEQLERLRERLHLE